MKKIKTLLALLLVIAMTVTMFAGCGNSEKSTDTADDTATVTKAADATDAEATAEPATSEDMAEITVMVLSLGPMGEGYKGVEDAINAITEKEINTHVTLTYVEVGSYAEQLSLAITGDEKVDLCLTTPIQTAGFSSMVAQNQLMPLNDLLNENAPETLKLVGDYLKGTTVNGNIYAVTTYRALSSGSYLIMRKDLLEKAGLLETAQNMTNWTEYESILKGITEQNDIAGISGNDGDGTTITLQNAWLDTEDFAGSTAYDNLGDTYKIIAVDDSGKVFNYFASEKYKAMIDRVRGWYEKGYVYKDSATTEEQGDNLIKTNVTFSTCINSELGVEASHGAATGYELVAKKLVTYPIGTGSTTKFTWAVPVCAKEPEAAVKFLNLMYTNKEIANLFAWGVEGRDYVVNDQGLATYPDGVDASSVQYHTADFLYGNQFLVYPWEGAAVDLRDQAKAEMEEGGVSPFLGFSCDTSKVANELTAIANVISEYKPGIETGTLDASKYDEFLQKLSAAGVDKVIAEYQTQLDAWKAAQ